MVKVSVIIPNYNHAAYLKQRLDSVLNQTYEDFEVIILDDCSADNSREIIEEYRNHEKIVSVIYNEVNTGNTFQQWDKGIKLAKGEYVWIAESDDWCENNLLETLIDGMEKDAECVLAYCQSYCIVHDNHIKFQSHHTKLAEYIHGRDFIKNYMLPRNPVFNAGMALWRRSTYHKMSKRFTEYKLIGDYCFWIELSRHGKVFISGKLLNYFRTHDKNISVNAIQNGMVLTEQIPLLNELHNESVIDETTYVSALKKSYFLFRSSKQNIPEENTVTIKKLFSSCGNVQYKFKFYFFQKLIQSSLKKAFKV